MTIDVVWGEAIRILVETIRIAVLMAVFLMVIPVISLMVASVELGNMEEGHQ
jgi:hypothetical protein